MNAIPGIALPHLSDLIIRCIDLDLLFPVEEIGSPVRLLSYVSASTFPAHFINTVPDTDNFQAASRRGQEVMGDLGKPLQTHPYSAGHPAPLSTV